LLDETKVNKSLRCKAQNMYDRSFSALEMSFRGNTVNPSTGLTLSETEQNNCTIGNNLVLRVRSIR